MWLEPPTAPSTAPGPPILRGPGVQHKVVDAAGVIVSTDSGIKYLAAGTIVTEGYVSKKNLREGFCYLIEPIDGCWVSLASLGLSDERDAMLERFEACGARVALPSRPSRPPYR